jgi:glycosyltransferase involved in cell wall biosynthesis
VDGKRALNKNVHFSPHGVDLDLFSRASDPATQPAEAVSTLPHPVIGFFGVVGEWVDHELVLFLARARPQWTFLFIGHTSCDVSRLREMPNIVLTGPKPYEELPLWARVFDVAVYPQRQNRQIKHSNPLKIREYLATGKPVVSITTPVTQRMSDMIYLADTHEDFLAAIERALREETPERRAQRMNSVAGESWDARFQTTVRIVEENLPKP